MQLRHEPAALVVSRQPLPTFDRSKYASAAGVSKGAYVLAGGETATPDAIIIATGSEVTLAIDAHEELAKQGIRTRVVSMPSWDIFEHQSQEYRDSVLPPAVTRRVAVEQASTFGWERYVGLTGKVIGMKTFGASAPLKELQKTLRLRARSCRRRRQGTGWQGVISDPHRVDLASGPLQATILPSYGMLVASLKWQGVELLRRIDDLESAASQGKHGRHTLALPLGQSPRRSSLSCGGSRSRARSQIAAPAFRRQWLADPWRALGAIAWTVMKATSQCLTAQGSTGRAICSRSFRFRIAWRWRSLSMTGLSIAVSVIARDEPVPVSFGFHPYFGLSDVPRADWRLHLPAMQRLALDARGIPTGAHGPISPQATMRSAIRPMMMALLWTKIPRGLPCRAAAE